LGPKVHADIHPGLSNTCANIKEAHGIGILYGNAEENVSQLGDPGPGLKGTGEGSDNQLGGIMLAIAPKSTEIRLEVKALLAEGHADLRQLDLTGADLSELDLSGCELSGQDLSQCSLRKARLSHARLVDAVLYQADLQGAEFLGADLSGADLSEVQAKGAGFGHAILKQARLSGGHFERCTFSGADLEGADLAAAEFADARFRDTNLKGVEGIRASFKGADLSEAKVHGANFREVDLRHARLTHIRGYSDALWILADTRHADWRGSSLFRRHMMDENYLYEFRTSSKANATAHAIWQATSDCGRSPTRWGLWTGFIAVSFAGIYEGMAIDYGAHEAPLSSVYFSIVTLTTLGFGDVLPADGWAQGAVLAEVILGYVMLGGLLSIFANKMARRA
jgi:uncharacterized protein YjbI with pentapeptide repeats